MDLFVNKIRIIFVLSFFCFVGASVQTKCMIKLFKEIVKKQKEKKEAFITKTKKVAIKVGFLGGTFVFCPLSCYLRRECYLDAPGLYAYVKNFVKASNKKEKNNCFKQIKRKIKEQYSIIKKYKELKDETREFKNKYLYDAKDFPFISKYYTLDLKCFAIKDYDHDILECLSVMKNVLDDTLVKIKKKKALIDESLIYNDIRNSVNRLPRNDNINFEQCFFPYYIFFGEYPNSAYKKICAYRIIKEIATNQDQKTVEEWNKEIAKNFDCLKKQKPTNFSLKLYEGYKKSSYADVAVVLKERD